MVALKLCFCDIREINVIHTNAYFNFIYVKCKKYACNYNLRLTKKFTQWLKLKTQHPNNETANIQHENSKEQHLTKWTAQQTIQVTDNS